MPQIGKSLEKDKNAIGALFLNAPYWLLQQGMYVQRINVKSPSANALVIISVTSTEGPQICFVSGLDVGDAARKTIKLLKAGELKWRTDEFALRRFGE